MKTTLALALAFMLVAAPASAAPTDLTGKAGTITTSSAKILVGKDGTILIQAADGKTMLMLEHDGSAMLLAPDGRLMDVDGGKAKFLEPAAAAEPTGELREMGETLKKETAGS